MSELTDTLVHSLQTLSLILCFGILKVKHSIQHQFSSMVDNKAGCHGNKATLTGWVCRRISSKSPIKDMTPNLSSRRGILASWVIIDNKNAFIKASPGKDTVQLLQMFHSRWSFWPESLSKDDIESKRLMECILQFLVGLSGVAVHNVLVLDHPSQHYQSLQQWPLVLVSLVFLQKLIKIIIIIRI